MKSEYQFNITNISTEDTDNEFSDPGNTDVVTNVKYIKYFIINLSFCSL